VKQLSRDELVKMVDFCDHPVVQAKLTLLRRKETSSKHFRELLREVTSFIGYSATTDLETKSLSVDTPMATHEGVEVSSKVALVPIMRSGLGMVDTMLDILPSSPVYHLGLFRNPESMLPVLYYNKLPAKCEVDRVLVLEPLIATAGTITAVLDILEEWGAKEVHLVTLIASTQGLSKLFAEHPNVKVHVAAIDDTLDSNGYILPGLGDAGERINNSIASITVDPVEQAAKRQKV